MSYYFSAILQKPFEKCIEDVKTALLAEGFGVITDIDIKATMKQKLNREFRNYRILGACNPKFALKALEAEDKIGTMLPCNLIVQEREDGTVEVAAVDPLSSMQAVENDALVPIANEIRGRLQSVINTVSQN